MMEPKLMTKALYGALLLTLLTPSVAHAYIDPGSGAFILQVIGIFFAGLLFYFRHFLAQGMSLLQKITRKGRDKSGQPDTAGK